MTVEQQVLEKLRELPPQKQKEVFAFVNRLQGKIWERTSAKPVRSLVGPGCEGE
jgi:hypothetical protein